MNQAAKEKMRFEMERKAQDAAFAVEQRRQELDAAHAKHQQALKEHGRLSREFVEWLVTVWREPEELALPGIPVASPATATTSPATRSSDESLPLMDAADLKAKQDKEEGLKDKPKGKR